ncbi:hypothetical protein [Flagellimonas sp. CMM7]|uniref:hypothetical protein n=1 Tax=Flagellimonas sp. CMM7 TaxID=2654676 RepID=UPI0013D280EE|nr:hypothetical protein [Flagellimonas sp. CMM7]UII81131.1 hypothetical protein LV704_06345 [Flagellimonas sp. CMM7]
MKNIQSILLKLLIILLLFGCNEKSKNEGGNELSSSDSISSKYFLKLTGHISPYMTYRPRIPITKKEAEDTNHYKVDYDSEGRIIKVMHYSKGLLNNYSYFGIAVVSLEYKNTQLIRRYFDHNNKPASVRRHFYGRGENQGIHKEVFELDADGRRKSLVLYNEKDEQIETEYGTYRFEWETQNDSSFIQRALKKNGEINILMDYFDFYVTHITTDENGYLDLIKNYGKDGKELVLSEKKKAAYTDFDFDEYGNEVSYTFHDEDGNLVDRQDTGYASFGYAQVKYIRKTPSKGVNDGLETVFFDKNNRRVTASDSVARHVRYHNDNGDIIAFEYYSLNEEKIIPPGIGYFRSERHYNKSGDIKETRYYDTDGRLTNNPSDGAAIVKLIYDDSRNILRIEKQDKFENVLKD